MSVVSPTWLSLSGEANYLRSTYIDGFLDVSSSRGVLLRSDVSFGSRLIMSTSNFTGTVSPNSTAAASATYSTSTNSTSSWSNNGITWSSVVSTGSHIAGAYIRTPEQAFDTVITNSSGWLWGGGSPRYATTTPFAYAVTTTGTTLQNSVGTTYGEWLQINSSVPVVMKNYQLYSDDINATRHPKTYFIAGSSDNSTWYPIIKVVMTSNPTTAHTSAGVITIPSGTTTNGSGTTTAGYAYTYTTYENGTTGYSYFRIITTHMNGGDGFGLGEWNINFTPSPAITSVITLAPSTTNYGQLDLTGGLTSLGIGTNNPTSTLHVAGNAVITGDVSFGSRLIMSTIFPPLVGLNGTVSPNSTAATSTTWSNNGITWTSNASSTLASGYETYKSFDNNSGSFWHDGTNGYVSTTGVADGTISTLLYSNGSSGSTFAANGEWLQIRSSVPATMKDFTLYSRTGYIHRSPKTFYLVGSNNGSTWTTIMYGTTTSTTAAANSATVTLSGLSSSGTISNFYSTTALTYTTYGNLSTPFTYFRLIVNAVCGADNTVNISEWKINFTPSPAITSVITLAPSTTAYGQLDLTGGLTTTQNVGIGTTNPTSTLHVAGNITGSLFNLYSGESKMTGDWVNFGIFVGQSSKMSGLIIGHMTSGGSTGGFVIFVYTAVGYHSGGSFIVNNTGGHMTNNLSISHTGGISVIGTNGHILKWSYIPIGQ